VRFGVTTREVGRPKRRAYRSAMNCGNGIFPGLLPIIIDLAEFLRVQPELSGHLHLGRRQPVTALRLRPRLLRHGGGLRLRHPTAFRTADLAAVCGTETPS
jgi:hypothetical protein